MTKAYYHEQLRDDDDRAMHDHPSDNTSIILEGGYIEHTPEGSFERLPGDIIKRKAADLHRLELRRDENGNPIPSKSIFIMGPKIREWGFMCPDKGWVHWTVFCKQEDTNEVTYGLAGKGCE